MGGVDKTKLQGSKEDILKELKRLEKVVAQGGFIPHIDHRCPPRCAVRELSLLFRK